MNCFDVAEGALRELAGVITAKGHSKFVDATGAFCRREMMNCLNAVQSLSDEFGDYEFSPRADRIMDRTVRALRGPALHELAKQKRNR